MSRITIGDAARRIWVGYAGILRGLGWLLALLAATVAASAAIVFPLWYVSIHYRALYTTVVLSLFAAGIVYLIGRKVHAWLLRPAKMREGMFRRIVIRTLVVLTFIVSLYVILGLFVVGILGIAIPLITIYIAALGYILYVHRSSHDSR